MTLLNVHYAFIARCGLNDCEILTYFTETSSNAICTILIDFAFVNKLVRGKNSNIGIHMDGTTPNQHISHSEACLPRACIKVLVLLLYVNICFHNKQKYLHIAADTGCRMQKDTDQVPAGFEPASPDSKSGVLTTTLWDL